MHRLDELFDILGLKPNNIDNYNLALTHPSFNAFANTRHMDYERLEYMGDAVLDYVTADLIFRAFPTMNPGEMSKLRSYLVNTRSLSSYARNINLYKFIKVGNSISQEQVAKSDRMLEDSYEALIGAIYLDQGIEVASEYIKKVFNEDILSLGQVDLTDYKSKLQEEMQAEHRDTVHYVLVKETGPSHDKTFVVNVMFNDIVLGTGTGKTKKVAEEEAAKNALSKRSV